MGLNRFSYYVRELPDYSNPEVEFSSKWSQWVILVGILLVAASCNSTPLPEPGLPPSASDLELLGSTRLCDDKALVLSQWKGTNFSRAPWGAGERLERLAQGQQLNHEAQALAKMEKDMSRSVAFGSKILDTVMSPFKFLWKLITEPVETLTGVPKGIKRVGTRIGEHDRFYFFNKDDTLVGAIFRYTVGLNLRLFPVLRQTLSELPHSSAFFLDSRQLLQAIKAKSATLYRTGDKTSTTQYLVLDDEEAPLLLVASMAIDPYEQLLSSYQETYLPGLVLTKKAGEEKDIELSRDKKFLALQQFARGEAAMFSSCGRRQPDVAVGAYRQAVEYGFTGEVRLAESHHRLGLALRETGEVKDAQVHLERALEIRPNVPEVINNLGSVLAQQKKQDQAVKLFEQAIVLRPNYARARFNLAEALEKMDVRRAIEEYETYLALVEGISEEERRISLAEERLKRLKGKK